MGEISWQLSLVFFFLIFSLVDISGDTTGLDGLSEQCG